MAEALVGLTEVAHLAMQVPVAHTAVELVGLGLTKTTAHLAHLPAAASALSVSSGVLAEAIRRTPQTSN